MKASIFALSLIFTFFSIQFLSAQEQENLKFKIDIYFGSSGIATRADTDAVKFPDFRGRDNIDDPINGFVIGTAISSIFFNQFSVMMDKS